MDELVLADLAACFSASRAHVSLRKGGLRVGRLVD